MKTTLNKILLKRPCGRNPVDAGALYGFWRLKTYLGEGFPYDREFSLLDVLQSNNVGDTTWCFRAVTGHEREMRLFAVFCARQVLHLVSSENLVKALDVAERFADGRASLQELVYQRDSLRTPWEEAKLKAETQNFDSHYMSLAYAIEAVFSTTHNKAALAANDAACAAACAGHNYVIRREQREELRRILSQ